MLYCPLLYYNAVKATFTETTIFERVSIPPSKAQDLLHALIPDSLLQRYPWAFRLDLDLPRGYALLKHKKSFAIGRSIVAYRNTPLAAALKACAFVVQAVSGIAFPASLDPGQNVDIWSSIHHFFESISDDERIVLRNDDIIGFFNSLPRVLASWHEAKQRYLRQHAGPPDLTFSIDFSTTHSQFRMYRGKVLLRTIRLDNIGLFISIVFAASIFLTLGHVYQQTRGATIGNQLSPALCALAIAHREQIWADSFQQFLHSQRHLFCFNRYVDNRMLLIDAGVASSPPFQFLFRDTFYTPPVLIEPVNDVHYLGFRVLHRLRQVRFIMPHAKWQVRHPLSTASRANRFSGYLSRVALIRKYTVPWSFINTDIAVLQDFYKSHGFTLSELQAATSRRSTF